MNLHLPEPQAAAFANLATRTGCSASQLAAEAVGRLLAQENCFDARVQLGIDRIARGEFLEEEAMDARMARMMRG